MANENLTAIKTAIADADLAELRKAYKVVDNAIGKYEKYDIANASITMLASHTYTGSAITPLPVVKINGVTLTKDTHYTLSYANNTAVGDTAYVTVQGVAPYFWSKKLYFSIVAADSE